MPKIQRALITIVTSLTLLGCATTAPSAPPAPEDDATEISFVITSWGYAREHWMATARGEAVLYMPAPNSRFQDPLIMSSSTISPEDFARLRAAMVPARRFIEKGVPCELAFTDAPSGQVRWVRPNAPDDEVNFYTGCRDSPEREQFFSATDAADAIFHQATGLH